eukprot:206345_1
MTAKGRILFSPGMGAYPANKDITPTMSVKPFAGLTSESQYSYRFNVSDSQRMFFLAADSEAEMNGWIKTFTNAAFHLETSSLTKQVSLTPYSRNLDEDAPEGIVTLIFTDIQSSTILWENEPDAMDKALEIHDAIMRELLALFGGYEVKTEGDAFMVAFQNPLDAVLWSIAAQRKLLSQNWPEDILKVDAAKMETDSDGQLLFNGPRVRIGVHTGKVTCRRSPITGRMDYFGQNVNLASRVSDAGHGGQVVATQEVHDLIEAARLRPDRSIEGVRVQDLSTSYLGQYRLKGIKNPVRIHNVTEPRLDARSFPDLRASKWREEKSDEEEEIKSAPTDFASIASRLSVHPSHPTTQSSQSTSSSSSDNDSDSPHNSPPLHPRSAPRPSRPARPPPASGRGAPPPSGRGAHPPSGRGAPPPSGRGGRSSSGGRSCGSVGSAGFGRDGTPRLSMVQLHPRSRRTTSGDVRYIRTLSISEAGAFPSGRSPLLERRKMLIHRGSWPRATNVALWEQTGSSRRHHRRKKSKRHSICMTVTSADIDRFRHEIFPSADNFRHLSIDSPHRQLVQRHLEHRLSSKLADFAAFRPNHKVHVHSQSGSHSFRPISRVPMEDRLRMPCRWATADADNTTCRSISRDGESEFGDSDIDITPLNFTPERHRSITHLSRDGKIQDFLPKNSIRIESFKKPTHKAAFGIWPRTTPADFSHGDMSAVRFAQPRPKSAGPRVEPDLPRPRIPAPPPPPSRWKFPLSFDDQ